jgi:hypothetical protein
MRAVSSQDQPPTKAPNAAILAWRTERLITAGFPARLAGSIATDGACDLHALLSLVDRGCPPELAAQILAPLDCTESQC